MKHGYLLLDTVIDDPETYEDYKAQVVPIVESFGGEYLIRGGEMTVEQDELWQPNRIVLLRFPSVAQAQAFLNSEAYAPVKAVRLANSRATAVVIEGL